MNQKIKSRENQETGINDLKMQVKTLQEDKDNLRQKIEECGSLLME